MAMQPEASMVFDARSAGMLSASCSTTPQRMPMSRLARSDWLGSSTSPPLMTRSNLSFGPMTARAGPARVTAAADVESARKSRRDSAVMAFLPKLRFSCLSMMRPRSALRKHRRAAQSAPRKGRVALRPATP